DLTCYGVAASAAAGAYVSIDRGYNGVREYSAAGANCAQPIRRAAGGPGDGGPWDGGPRPPPARLPRADQAFALRRRRLCHPVVPIGDSVEFPGGALWARQDLRRAEEPGRGYRTRDPRLRRNQYP